MSGTILLLTRRGDPTGDHLASAVSRRNIPVFRFDTCEFPCGAVLDASLHDDGYWHGTLTCKQGHVALESIRSVWYFHPTHYQVNDQLPEPYRDFAEGETRKGFGGVLRSIPCFWVSYPDAITDASFKPLQLKVARDIGFQTPRTLVTNSPDAFRRFYEECGGNVITKAMYTGFLPMGGDEYHSIYTSVVTPDILQFAENVRHTATMFQEYLPKKLELRITVIGQKVLTVAIHSQASTRTRVDWRRSYEDLTYSVFDLPADIEQKCLKMVQALHLNYGCIDMIVTPQDELKFLEINAVGQYLWLEQVTGLAFTEALADLLVEGGAA